jgi:replication initiation and membrane attachment protein
VNKLDLLKESVIEISCHLSPDNYKTLNLLYLPLIKEDSLTCYMVLYNIINQQSLQTKIYNRDLLDILGMTQSKFQKSISKLEAIGLVNTYCKDASFLFCLIPPLNARQFFLDGVLGNFLLQKVGESNYNYLQSLFTITHTNKNDYQNVTQSFDEVFDYQEIDKNINVDNYYVDDTFKNKVNIKNKEFNFDLFYTLLNSNNNFYKTLKFKEFIIKNAFIYNLSESNMKSIFDSIDETNLTYDLIQDKITKYYNANNQSTVESQDVMHTLSKKSLFEILTILLKREPLGIELNEFNKIFDKYNLSNEAFNLIVIYCIVKNKFTLPHINYFKTVIENFIQNNRTEAIDILKYLQTDREIQDKNNKSKPSKVERPEWVDDFINKLN